MTAKPVGEGEFDVEKMRAAMLAMAQNSFDPPPKKPFCTILTGKEARPYVVVARVWSSKDAFKRGKKPIIKVTGRPARKARKEKQTNGLPNQTRLADQG